VRHPSSRFRGRDFRLITTRAEQQLTLVPICEAIWNAARPGLDWATLVKKLRPSSSASSEVTPDAVIAFARSMVAAGLLLSRPEMGPFAPAGRCEAHIFRWGTETLAIDPATCSLWGLTGDGAACLGESCAPIPHSWDETTRRSLSPVAAELGACNAAGFFRSRCVPSSTAPAASGTGDRVLDEVGLTLELSQVCNLACRYCHVGRERTPAVMSDATMRDAVDFVFRTIPAKRYKVAFVPNGEPLLNLKRTREVQLYAAERARELGLKVEFPSGVSNAVNLTPEVLRRWKACFPTERFTLSLDGPEHVHDAMRVDSRGRGSYADVVRALNLVKSDGCLGVVGAVLTPQYPKVLDIFQHLRGLGAEWISIKPVRLPPSHPLAFNERNIEELCDEYTRFANWLLEQGDKELMRLLGSLSRVDYFRRFVQRLAAQQGIPRRCPASSRHALMVDHRGDIYTCASMTGNKSARIGSIYTGIDPELIKFFEHGLTVTSIAGCRSCWARFICGGGCYHQAFLTNGRFDEPDPAECHLNRHIIQLAGWFLADLAHRGPNLLRAAVQTVRPRPPRRRFALSLRKWLSP